LKISNKVTRVCTWIFDRANIIVYMIPVIGIFEYYKVQDMSET